MGGITVTGLGKAYKQYSTRWARLAEWLLPGGRPRHTLKWVLQDLSFAVSSGEAVGILGINGAGKSTLLKMITGTTQPTTGSVTADGRIAALLELGMGFHPDFTGRQNAVMSGQLLGFSAEEIAEAMPRIEAFAEIGDYLAQPVRIYSSGMQVRLAFSLATAIRPSILIIDEALAVGDIAFQRKCFARIQEYREQGTTLLFVSHDLETVKRLCDRVILLKDGRIEAIDTPKIVCQEFERILFGGAKKAGPDSVTHVARLDPNIVSRVHEEYGDGCAVISNCRFEDKNDNVVNVFDGGDDMYWKYSITFHTEITDPIFSLMVKTREGVCVYYIDSSLQGLKHGSFRAGDVFHVTFLLQNNLAPGTYFINCSVRTETADSQRMHHRLVDVAIVAVSPRVAGRYPSGLADLCASLTLTREKEGDEA